MLANMIMTNRFILLFGHTFVLGGAFVSPLLFILGDIIAELYGFKLSKRIIWSAFACQFIFVIAIKCVMLSPAPGIWHGQDAFNFVFGSLLRINISSFLAFVFATLLNAYILTRWKELVHGKYFWLRSLGSSTFAEALYSAFAIIMIEFNNVSPENIFSIILFTYLIKVIYSTVFAFPANFIVNLINRHSEKDKIDPAQFIASQTMAASFQQK